jgi:hypothetical protein
MDNYKNEKTVNEVSSRFTVMPDKTKDSSQSIIRGGNFGFGYEQDLPGVSTDNLGSKTDNIRDTSQGKSHWSQTREAVYQKRLSSSYGTHDSRFRQDKKATRAFNSTAKTLSQGYCKEL